MIKSINEIQIIKHIIFDESQLNAVNYLRCNHFMVESINKLKNRTFKKLGNTFTLDDNSAMNKRINKFLEDEKTLITCLL